MRKFLATNDAAFHDLEERARWACIRFRNQEMPPGCHPNRADVGFEIDDATGSARLLVSRGIHYSGDSTAVQEWFDAGEKRFPSFEALRAWIQGPLDQAFNAPSAPEGTRAGVTPLGRTPAEPARSSGGGDVNVPHAVFTSVSNQGSKPTPDEPEIQVPFGNRAIEDEVCRRRLCAAGFAAEIADRISRLHAYRPLNPQTRAEIVRHTISEFAEELGFRVDLLEPSVLAELIQTSRSHCSGVRPEQFLLKEREDSD